LQSEELLVDTESFKIQSYFLEEFPKDYKHLLINLNQQEIEKNFDENLHRILCKENSYLRQIYESMNSTVRVQQTNVKYNF
jgi:hypothetical protein